jgi:hypothetical protein
VFEVGVVAKEKVAMKKIQEIHPMGIHKVKTKNEVDIQKVKILLDIIWSKRNAMSESVRSFDNLEIEWKN